MILNKYDTLEYMRIVAKYPDLTDDEMKFFDEVNDKMRVR